MQEISPKMVKTVSTGFPGDIPDTAERNLADIFLSKPVAPEALHNMLEIKLREEAAGFRPPSLRCFPAGLFLPEGSNSFRAVRFF
jgi:hypothetical protein